MSDELLTYDVIVNGAETTMQLTEAEAALRFPGVKPHAKKNASHAQTDDHAVSNKARHNK